MDESESLEKLVSALGSLTEKPYDVSLHSEFFNLAQSLENVDEEVRSGLEMITQFMAAGNEIWLYLLNSKKESTDTSTAESVDELLALYDLAEADYLSIPILESHLDFLIEQHERYASGDEMKADDLGDRFSTVWTRSAIDRIVKKGLPHLSQSHKLFERQWEWELQALESSPKKDRPAMIEQAQHLILSRLRQPSADMEATFQFYSSFVSNFFPPQDYEKLLVSASKMRSDSVKAYERREQKELALKNSAYSLEAYDSYIKQERRAKYPDVLCIRGIHERAIAEAAKRRFAGLPGSEEALRLFWTSYCDTLRVTGAGLDFELEVVRRATRSVPGAGEIWARYIRLLERVATSERELFESLETVVDVYNRAIDTKLLQNDIEQLIPVVLARAGFERRQLERGVDAENTLLTLITILESGIDLVRQASKTGDAKLRLEKFLVEVYELTGLEDNAIELWQAASKHNKTSYTIWIGYTETLIKFQRHEEARQVFNDVHSKNVDWPEAIWEAWASFEHRHGSVEQLETCLDKIERAQYQTNARRAKEAEKAMQQQMQAAADAQAAAFANSVVESVVAEQQQPQEDSAMSVDAPAATVDRGVKRTAQEDAVPTEKPSKKAKMESNPPPLKRDRENATVFVGDLPSEATEEDLQALFKDCGEIREVKISDLKEGHVGVVEFVKRDSVPAALTKDKKRIRNHEISVHLAWRSTLYITNFPEAADDEYIRNLFSKYGPIFETRWPSKKFKATRRFCYLQYTSPDSAQRALELHNQELEPGLRLSVYVSDPERKKERTDHDADEREVYVAGLSRYTTKGDLEKLFATYGPLKDVRMALDDSGHSKGFAFIEYEATADASKALMANNYELKKRRIAVTMADSRVRARHKSELGLSRAAESRNRSVHVKNLPPATQEGLLQQAFEKIVPVKRVEVLQGRCEAILELQNPADVGKLLLRTEPITFGGSTLELSEEIPVKRPAAAGAGAGDGAAMFKPRHVGPSKPKAGLGFKKSNPVIHRDTSASAGAGSSTASGGGKGQDDFRRMLLEGK